MKPPKGLDAVVAGAVRAGCVVNPPGRAPESSPGGLPQPQGFWENAYLALTDEELVLVRIKRGMARMNADTVLARIPRAAVTGAAIGASGMERPLRLDLTDGSAWTFGLAPFEAKHGEELIAALGVVPVGL